MNRKRLTLMVCLMMACSAVSSAQSGTPYEDTINKFKITLLGDWRAVAYNDAVGRPKTDFIYRDRSEGLLKIVRENLGSRTLGDITQDEEQNMRVSHPNFEMGGVEQFAAGTLQGKRMSYFYTEGSRKFTVTDYFLQDGSQLWVLRFTGRRGVVDQIRNVTDEMARSFRPNQ